MNIRLQTKIIVFSALFLLLFNLRAQASQSIYIKDLAQVLNQSEQNELTELGSYLHEHTGTKIILLTVDSLEGEMVEEYALKASRQYGLGSKEEGVGALILLSEQDRKIFIEAGYDIERILRVGVIGEILDVYALPYLEEQKMNEALMNTYKQLFNELAIHYELGKQADAKGYEYNISKDPPIFLIIGICLAIVAIVWLDFKFSSGAITSKLLNLIANATSKIIQLVNKRR